MGIITKTHHAFYCGDALRVLRSLPEESVHCCITSPPYWGLRDYGIEGQYGLEATPDEYVDKMLAVFHEVKRVLRNDGTLWLNLGDSYAGSWGAMSYARDDIEARRFGGNCEKISRPVTSRLAGELKAKDLVGIPWRTAFALQADGWYLRSDIIWAKPNPMPESVTDRPTRSHEYVFLFTKNRTYYYDAEAIKEEAVSHLYDKRYGPESTGRDRSNEPWNKDGAIQPHKGFKSLDTTGGRNKRDVWTISPEPFPEAHFATFPQGLVEPCILAGTSPMACPECGSPWKRVMGKSLPAPGKGSGNKERKLGSSDRINSHFGSSVPWQPTMAQTEGWTPTCSCSDNDGTGSSVVLDCFGGAGTVSIVAKRLERSSIYIDLNPKYLEMAVERADFGCLELFAEHTYEVCYMEQARAE